MRNSNPIKLALCWLFIIISLLTYNTYLLINNRISFNTDILALLPKEQRDPLVKQATDHMFNTIQQQVAVLVGAPTWLEAVHAADEYSKRIQSHSDIIQFSSTTSEDIQNTGLNLFINSRLGLLTASQKNNLETKPLQYWSSLALSQLYTPFGGPKILAWKDDPFGLFKGWLQERAQETPVRPRDGKLFVADEKNNYVVLLMHLNKSAFALSTQKAVIPLLESAQTAAQKISPHVTTISTGVILHAAFGSQEAHHEASTIAVGSVLGILLLMWLCFRSIKPILLIGSSILIGCLGTFSLCELLLGQIHLLTLVFGASLIGIAQDYGIYFLCSRLGAEKTVNSSQLLQTLWPGLILTLTAALIGYMVLAFTPFPGLQQMALFSGLGLIFAWLTVIFWFPLLIKSHTFQASKFANKLNASLIKWPLLGKNKFTFFTATLFFLFIVMGISKLHIQDDIRALEATPQRLINDQLKFTHLLQTPTFVQFYLVRGETEQVVLEREEKLKQLLAPFIHQNIIQGIQAISNWVPSLQTQKENQRLVKEKLLSANSPLDFVSKNIGEDSLWANHLKKQLLSASTLLTPDSFFSTTTISKPWRYLWLGKVNNEYASIVVIRGLENYKYLVTLKIIATKTPGVQWVDKISEISQVLGHYRFYMSWVILIAYCVIYLLLYVRYKLNAWRVIAPPAFASTSTLAFFGIIGLPIQLFHVLAFMLILGLGVDYGIFLQESARQNKSSPNYAWLTIGLSAVSALLSFGLLALSKTPPLHAFGLTMLIGMTLVWLIAPCFRNSDTIGKI